MKGRKNFFDRSSVDENSSKPLFGQKQPLKRQFIYDTACRQILVTFPSEAHATPPDGGGPTEPKVQAQDHQ